MSEDDGRCAHGIVGPCALCTIDRRDRIGARTAERTALMLSGACDGKTRDASNRIVAVLERHEECRMIGCECPCHSRESFGDALGRGIIPRA